MVSGLGEVKALEATYQGIGDFFKQKCQGYKGYLLQETLTWLKRLGLKTKRRIPFFNER